MAAPQVAVRATDDELIEGLRAGDKAAFDSLYERYLSRVYPFVAQRRLSRAATEALVHEVLANVFSSLHTYCGNTSFVVWVLGVLRHTLARRLAVQMVEDPATGGTPAALLQRAGSQGAGRHDLR